MADALEGFTAPSISFMTRFLQALVAIVRRRPMESVCWHIGFMQTDLLRNASLGHQRHAVQSSPIGDVDHLGDGAKL
jgi:hypothetical protein